LLPSAASAIARPGWSEATIAIAVNGRLAAVSELIEWEGEGIVDALFWPGFLVEGKNVVRLFEIRGDVLHEIP
jgi:hypothetical protein